MASLSRYQQGIPNGGNNRQIYCERPDTCYQQGEDLANSGYYQTALAYFDRTIELQQDHSPAWVFRAVVLIHLNRHEEALASCDKALEINPDDREAWTFRGAALSHLGRYQEAYESYDKATGIQQTSGWRKMLAKMIGCFKHHSSKLFSIKIN